MSPPAEGAAALDSSGEHQLFLQSGDLRGLTSKGPRFTDQPDNDPDFSDRGGTRFGMATWNAPQAQGRLWRVVDIRWIFTSERAAQAYLEAHRDELAEGPPISLPDLAPGFAVYGGAVSSPLRLGGGFRSYACLLVQGRVLAKVYAAGDSDSDLRAEDVSDLARVASRRIQGQARPSKVGWFEETFLTVAELPSAMRPDGKGLKIFDSSHDLARIHLHNFPQLGGRLVGRVRWLAIDPGERPRPPFPASPVATIEEGHFLFEAAPAALAGLEQRLQRSAQDLSPLSLAELGPTCRAFAGEVRGKQWGIVCWFVAGPVLVELWILRDEPGEIDPRVAQLLGARIQRRITEGQAAPLAPLPVGASPGPRSHPLLSAWRKVSGLGLGMLALSCLAGWGIDSWGHSLEYPLPWLLAPALGALLGLANLPLVTLVAGGLGLGYLGSYYVELTGQRGHPQAGLAGAATGMGLLLLSGVLGLAERVRSDRQVDLREGGTLRISVPPAGPTDPSRGPKRARMLVAAALLAALLVVGVGLARWERRTFCGELTPPTPVTDVGPCEGQLRELGRKLSAARVQGKFPDHSFPDYRCPRCGLFYCYLLSDDLTRAWLFCPGHAHNQTNAPAYDFERGEVTQTAIEPPAGSWPHFQWCLRSQQDSAYSQALEEAGGLSKDANAVALYRGQALLALHRESEALQALESIKSPSPTAWDDKVSCLLGLGRYTEAFSVAHEHAPFELGQIHFLVGDDVAALEAARQVKEAVPDALLYWVPFTNRKYTEAFDEAGRWLEAGGYGRELSPYAVMARVISAMACGDEAHLGPARQDLARALSQTPRFWPFPVLRLVNGEIGPGDKSFEGISKAEQTELHAWLGCLLEAQGKSQEASGQFQWVKDNGLKSYLEYRLARSRVESLP